MSRRYLAVAALAACVVIPAHRIHAQMPASVGISAGATVPVSDYKDAVKTGYHAALSVDLHAPLSPVSLRLEGMFNELDVKEGITSSSEKSHVWAATANVLFNAGDLVVAHPYLIGGLGYYRASFTGQPFGFSIPAENKLGLNAGVGVALPLSGFKAFAEARYHTMLGSDSHIRFIPITFGVSF